MSLQALLAARAHAEGRAQPIALMRHRALIKDPLCITAWQLGAEPYSMGALAFGRRASGYQLFVPGYPLDRHLLFASLLDFAKTFCPEFESFARGPKEAVEHMGEPLLIPERLPQIVVPNAGTISLLGRLGRRLAYLPPDGPHAADPLLPRLGRHLMWVVEHAQTPGQQLIVPLADLLAQHYVTEMSSLEMQSLAAMDAWIAPPAGQHGFHAAEVAERTAVGPVANPDEAKAVHEMMKTINEQRARSTDPAYVKKFVGPLHRLYDRMVQRTWTLMWRVLQRERAKIEAPSVVRRVREDRIQYAGHIQWMNGPVAGRRKTRMTPRSAALRLHRLEGARARLLAEEAIDDPLRMAPHLLAGKALSGVVVQVDANRKERVGTRNCRRPSVTVRTEEPCAIPCGSELRWTRTADGREWRVDSALSTSSGGSQVTLILQTNRVPAAGLPALGTRACFSQLSTAPGYEMFLPEGVPWTHRGAAESVADDDLEASSGPEGQVA